MDFLNQFEAPILHRIQDIFRCEFLDWFMPLITKLGNGGIFWIALAVVLLCFKKTRRAGLAMGISLLIGLVITNLTLKPLIARTRPYIFDPSIESLLLIPHESDFSFPSGHTTASIEAAVALFCFHKKWGIVAIVTAVIVSLSRLYLMVHYPTDVLAAAVLAVVIGIVASKIANWVIAKTKMPAC